MKAIVIGVMSAKENEKNQNDIINFSEDHEQYNDFMKVLAIKNLIQYLLDLKDVNIKNPECKIDSETFKKYVCASDVIDHYFGNLIEGYIDNCECDDEDCECEDYENCTCGCCKDEDDNCDECDRKCNHDDDFDGEEDIIDDAFTLASMFKPVFNLENITEDSEVKIVMTGKEYLEIKKILDQYEFDNDDETTESSNT